MGKILEANQLTIGFRRHATSKSRSKWRISRNPDKPSRKNQLKPAGSNAHGERGGSEASEMLLKQMDRGTINAVDRVSLTIEKERFWESLVRAAAESPHWLLAF